MATILEVDSAHGTAARGQHTPDPVPLPHIRSVNTWLLRGDPLTLVDTGPHDDDALAALDAGLRRAGARIEDVELVLLTHHHLDHSGLAATIAARSGARWPRSIAPPTTASATRSGPRPIGGSRTPSCATTACRMP